MIRAMGWVALSLSIAGCVPTSRAQVRSACEQQYEYKSDRYNDCIEDGMANLEDRRANARAVYLSTHGP